MGIFGTQRCGHEKAKFISSQQRQSVLKAIPSLVNHIAGRGRFKDIPDATVQFVHHCGDLLVDFMQQLCPMDDDRTGE